MSYAHSQQHRDRDSIGRGGHVGGRRDHEAASEIGPIVFGSAANLKDKGELYLGTAVSRLLDAAASREP
jgi:hypothetical protein